MPSRGNNRTGRVHSHQRPHDNSVPIVLGENLSDIGDDYDNALHETVRLGMNDKCRKDCRQRQSKIVEFWEKSCPQCYEVGVREVTEDDQSDQKKFCFEKHKFFDLKHSGINVDYVLHFLTQEEKSGETVVPESSEETD